MSLTTQINGDIKKAMLAKEKAIEYYKRLLFEYPGSLFLVETRKRYRSLTE